MRFLLILIFCSTFSFVFGQKKTVRAYEQYTKPLFREGNDYLNFINIKAKDLKKNGTEWKVFPDRKDVTCFEKAGYESNRLDTLDFIENEFTVIDEEIRWLRIGREENGKFKVYGWVLKEEMLLWSRGLVNEKSGIHIKAFLLNKLSSFSVDKLERVPLYRGPTDTETEDFLPLYDYYYIYDVYVNPKSGETEKYLLGREASFRGSTIRENMMGWVDSYRVVEWNTRLALEPNFDESAFEERKLNKEFSVKGYLNEKSIVDVNNNLPVKEKYIIWDNDPVKGISDRIASTNPRRFIGDVQRFPVLQYKLKNCKECISSGVIADLNYDRERKLLTDIEEKSSLRKNKSVFFLIEGTKGLKKYKQAIEEVIVSLNGDIKVGVGTYRDFLESKSIHRFDNIDLTRNKNKVLSYLSNIEYASFDDNDDWTNFYYALNKSLIKTSFNKDETNILIHVGSSGDFSGNFIRRKKAELSGDFEKNSLKLDEIMKRATDLQLNFIHVQVNNSNGKASLSLQDNIRNLMTSISKNMYVEEKLKEIADAPVPYIPDFQSSNELVLNEFLVHFSFLRPSKGNRLSTTKLRDYLREQIDDIVEIQKEGEDILEKISANKFDPGAGSFNKAAVLKILRDVARQSGLTTKEEIESFIKNLSKDEKFYTSVFFKSDAFENSKYPPFSYVLLYPESDLEEYIDDLEKLLNTAYYEDDVTRRNALKEYLIILATQFTDEEVTRKASQISLKQIAEYLQGIAGEGYDVFNDGGLDFKIEDITNRKKFTDEKLDEFINRLESKVSNLKSILNRGSEYEFSFKNGQYFWIPINEVF